MEEESAKIEDMRKRGRISAGQAEKLRQALPSPAKKAGASATDRRMRWAVLGVAGAAGIIGGIALLAFGQWRIHDSTRRIESNLDALRQQGFVLPSHFQNVIPMDTATSELVYEKDGKSIGLPLRRTDVQVDIHTDVARVFVTQLYVNPTDQVLEALYLFPLPHNSAVDSMIMTVGSKRIHGIIQKRQEARATYEQARKAGKTASLLEQERPNIFTQSVANILPQDSILITISFLQEIKHIAPYYYYHFPTVVGPRYTAHTPDSARITPPVANPADGKFASQRPRLNLELRLHAGVPVRNLESASHKLAIQSLEEKDIHLRLSAADSIPNKDFLLKYQLAGETILPALQSEDGHFKLTVMPQFDPAPDRIFNRELVFVMDVSGSMHGFPLEKSKEVMGNLLRNMRKEDRFRLVTFASGTRELSPDALAGDSANIGKALAFLSAARGGGGTEMLAAVRKVLSYEHRDDCRRIFLFLTDGYIGNDNEIIRAVRENLGESRVFSLGVGSSVNRSLLEGMAVVGRGVGQFIRQDGSAQEAMQDFYRTVESPVLSNLTLDWKGIEVEDVLPENLPDLFLGHPLTVLGKYRGQGRGTLTLNGLLPGGKKFRQTLPVDFAALPPSSLAVKALWARRKVEDLELYHSGILGNAAQPPDTAKAQIERLGLQYRIMTAHTSFVAVLDQVRNTKGEWLSMEQLVELPEGMDTSGVMAHFQRGTDLKHLSASSASSLSSMDLQNQLFASGLDKVITRVASTRPSARRGKVDGGWNEGYAVGGSGGVDDLLGGLWGGDAGPLGVKAKGGAGLMAPKIKDLAFQGVGLRSAASIIQVIRAHTPGLRHLHNKQLKVHPGLKGRITFKIAIDASGAVTEVKVVESTTGVPEFDEEIRKRIATWRFEPVKGTARDVVTTPFNFLE